MGFPLTQSTPPPRPRENPVLPFPPCLAAPGMGQVGEVGIGESHLPLPLPMSPELDLGRGGVRAWYSWPRGRGAGGALC